MRKKITAFMTAAAAAAALVPGCSEKISDFDGTIVPESGIVTVTVNFSNGGFAEHETRSSFTWQDDAITDAELVVVGDDGVVDEVLYSQNASGLSFKGQVGSTYHIWAAANIGGRTEVSVLSDFTGGTRSVNYSQIASNGVPMYSAKADGEPGPVSITISEGTDNITIPMVRMLAKVDFKIDKSKLSNASGFKVRYVRMYNAINSYSPFTANVRQAHEGSIDHSFDYASNSDVSALNGGSSITMYAFENMQGELLAGNSDPWAKVPSGINGSSDYCTYIEMGCSYASGGLSSDDIIYRMYLGSNSTTNFDVKRNTRYSITLYPTEAEIDGHRGSWKIENSGWNSTLTGLSIAPSSSVVTVGESQTYTVTAHYSDGTSADVTSRCSWTSDNKSTATVADAVAAGLSAGTAHITASFEDKNVSATLTVKAHVPVETYDYELELLGDDVSVMKGGTAPISRDAELTTYIYRDGTYYDTDYRTVSATLYSDDTSVATVSGLKVTGKEVGTTTVYGDYGGIISKNKISVTVYDDPPSDIVTQYEYMLEVTPGTMTLDEGGTGYATAVFYTRSRTGTKRKSEPESAADWGSWSDWSGEDVTDTAMWSSSSSTTAAVSEGAITANSHGSATITATYTGPDGNVYSDNLLLTVNQYEEPLTVVAISLDGPTELGYMEMGEYTITAKMSDGSFMTIDADDPGVTISVNSNAFTVRKGNSFEIIENGDILENKIYDGNSFTVSASYEGCSGSISGSIKYVVASVEAEIRGSWSNSDSAGADWYYFSDAGKCTVSGNVLSLLPALNLFPSSYETYLRFDYIAVSYNIYCGNNDQTANIEYYSVYNYNDGMSMTGDRRYRICSFDLFGFKTTVFMGMQ